MEREGGFPTKTSVEGKKKITGPKKSDTGGRGGRKVKKKKTLMSGGREGGGAEKKTWGRLSVPKRKDGPREKKTPPVDPKKANSQKQIYWEKSEDEKGVRCNFPQKRSEERVGGTRRGSRPFPRQIEKKNTRTSGTITGGSY